jgi:hypothetical protein
MWLFFVNMPKISQKTHCPYFKERKDFDTNVFGNFSVVTLTTKKTQQRCVQMLNRLS